MPSLAPLQSTVDLFVVDTSRAAPIALGAHRPATEATHVLCRHDNEGNPEFTYRVHRRAERLSKTKQIRGLWYVVGPEEASASSAPYLLHSLLALLSSGSSLTLVGPATRQASVLLWIDELLQRGRPGVTVRVQLYPNQNVPVHSARDPHAFRPRYTNAPPPEHEAEVLLDSA